MFLIDDPLMAFRHAFRRSRIRVEIVLVLLRHGRQSLADLARLIGADEFNVYGALHGVEDRYRLEEALLLLGLVQVVEVEDGEDIYDLTSLGGAVGRVLRQEVERRRGVWPNVRA